MDVQRKKGIIEVCVLAVLKKGPSYGYMIIRELEQCLEISESTLYPILKRLEQNGSLKTQRQEYNGRIRKYYELTAEGQRKIDAFLDEWDEIRSLYQFVADQNAMKSDMTGEKESEEPAPEITEETAAAQTEAETTKSAAPETAPEITEKTTAAQTSESGAAEEGTES